MAGWRSGAPDNGLHLVADGARPRGLTSREVTESGWLTLLNWSAVLCLPEGASAHVVRDGGRVPRGPGHQPPFALFAGRQTADDEQLFLSHWRVPQGEVGSDGQYGLRVVAVRSGCAGGVKFGG